MLFWKQFVIGKVIPSNENSQLPIFADLSANIQIIFGKIEGVLYKPVTVACRPGIDSAQIPTKRSLLISVDKGALNAASPRI
jgi:hypothetical protein